MTVSASLKEFILPTYTIQDARCALSVLRLLLFAVVWLPFGDMLISDFVAYGHIISFISMLFLLVVATGVEVEDSEWGKINEGSVTEITNNLSTAPECGLHSDLNEKLVTKRDKAT